MTLRNYPKLLSKYVTSYIHIPLASIMRVKHHDDSDNNQIEIWRRINSKSLSKPQNRDCLGQHYNINIILIFSSQELKYQISNYIKYFILRFRSRYPYSLWFDMVMVECIHTNIVFLFGTHQYINMFNIPQIRDHFECDVHDMLTWYENLLMYKKL